MDSHHDQVMRQRELADASNKKLYFGYSTILDRPAFDEWRTQHGYNFFELPEGRVAEALDVTLVYDFPSRWWGGRVAGLADQPGASVFGRLYEIGGKDWPIIEHKEGAVTGMCEARQVKVRVGGETLTALAFTTRGDRRSNQGEVSQRFVEALVRGAEAAGLPSAWVKALPSTAR